VRNLQDAAWDSVYARRTNLNFLSKFFGDFLVENEGTVMQQIVACESAVLRQEGIDEVRPAPLGRIIWW